MENLIVFLNQPATFFILGILYLSGMSVSVFIIPRKRTKFHKFLLWIGIICALLILSLGIILFLEQGYSWYATFVPFCFFMTGTFLYFGLGQRPTTK